MGRGKGAALVFAAALGLRAAFFAGLLRSPGALIRPDTATYMIPAHALAQGRGFSNGAGPEASRTPGYPAFLAANLLLTDDPLAPSFTQLLLDSGTAALIAWAAPGPAGWAFGLLYALDPLAAAHAPLLLSETLFTFLLVLSVVFLTRAGSARKPEAWAALSGLCLGAATLTRPITLYLWLPWSLALAWAWRKRLAPALVFAATAALLPASWCARNAALWGSFEFSSITGVNALIWEAAAVQASVDGTGLEEGRRTVVAEFARRHPEPFADPFAESRERRALAGEILRAHPGQVLKLHLVSTVKMLLGPGLDLMAKTLEPDRPLPTEESLVYSVSGQGSFAVLKAQPRLWVVTVCIGVVLALAYGLGLVGIWTLLKAGRAFELAAVLTPLAYLLVLSGGGWSYYRFRLPLLPLFALLAAFSFERKRR